MSEIVTYTTGLHQNDVDRFWLKVQTSAECDCWAWGGYRDITGYGRMTIATGKTGGRPVAAHRVSYEIFKGEITKGSHIHHKCNHPWCVNPDHLECLTPAEHVAETAGHWKNQTHCIRGHEFTEENTHYYRGGRHCRACASLRFRQKFNLDAVESAPFSDLYCKHGHELFGENMTLIARGKGFIRRCKTCNRDVANRHLEANRDAVNAAKAFRRAKTKASQVEKNKARILEMVKNCDDYPVDFLIPTLRRLLRCI